jgi:putative ABC transport system permease protein
MKAIRLAARKLFRKGEHTTTRILSLATGLTFGLILLSEVFFYFSVDSFYPDSKRIYVVNENFKADKQSDKMTTHPLVSGAIGPGLKAEVPGIEAATRLNSIGTMVFYSEDNRGFNAHFVLADEHLPKVLPRPMISGLAEEILKTPMNCMVSDEIAQKMGGNVVGQVIEINEFPGKKLTIGGIFKSLPENTNFSYDIAISMVSTAQFTWDGTENWLGNDRYYTCVKLEKAISPESLAPAVRKMQEKHQNIKELELKHGVVLKYSFEAIQKVFVNQQKNILFILSAIAFIVLFVAVMNYMLLTLSTLAVRSKTLAIYKCYGAEKQNLHGMIFAESSLNFILSLLVALALILLFKPIAEAQLGHSLQAALNRQVIVPLLLILVFLVFVISYFTGRIFTKIPVAAAFRSYQQSKTKWKKALLAVQFISASLILTILVVVGLQFEKIKNTDHGYSAENVYYTEVSGMDPHKIEAVLNDLIALPEVKNAGFGCDVPIYGAAGNNILSPDGERVLFNLADFYYIDENYFSILDIPVIEGKGFEKEESSRQDVMISRNAAELLILNNGWHDGVIGRSISITEHGDNFRISGIMGPSGCGKSTLLNILGLLDNPTEGRYFFDNQQAGHLKERQRTQMRKGNIGFVFQSFNLIDELNVFENVELPLIYLKIPTRKRKEMVQTVLKRMNIGHREKHFPQQLSGGQQQRVAIARAVIANPKLILADEPTGNLDSKNGREVMDLLSELNREGTTIIMVTHSQHDAGFAHRIINLFDGMVVD